MAYISMLNYCFICLGLTDILIILNVYCSAYNRHYYKHSIPKNVIMYWLDVNRFSNKLSSVIMQLQQITIGKVSIISLNLINTN